MGLVKFKHRNGTICEAEFPLAEMPELVAFTLENGQEHHQAKALFLAEWTQVVPELPPTNAQNIPTMNVTQTPGDPVGTPVQPPQQPTSSAPRAQPVTTAHLADFLERVEEKLGELRGHLTAEIHHVLDAAHRIEAAHPTIVEGLKRLESVVAGAVVKSAD